MKAVAIGKLGGPEVLEVVELPEPTLSDGQVLIEVEATSYNHIDAILRTEDFGLDFPIVPGSDVVGRVIEGDANLRGRRVVVNPGLPCGTCDNCQRGLECRYVRILGVHQPGGYGQRLAISKEQCFPVSDELSLDVLASFPLAFLTAWRMLNTRAALRPGESVLVWGSNGGLGSAAVSIGKALGAEVIAVVRHPEHVQILADYGADSVIDASRQSVLDVVMDKTNGIGVDVVFEGPGAATWKSTMAAVAQSGRIVTAGVTSGAVVDLDIEDTYYRQISILGSRMGYQPEFAQILNKLVTGEVTPLISGVLGLSEAAEAHQIALAGGRCGKIVLRHDF